MSQRPDPDILLKHVQAEEALSHRGRLKLFFGASPGVGKTYAMLEAARQRKKEGWDVAVGLVETHGRTETEALLAGLEILPRKKVVYKNVSLDEFDLDGALTRRPRLILVDELAHSNAPGLRHLKRWQDIEELLEAGIDVYTTLNVQHWESLNDVVAKITNVAVRETVPDTFLRQAHEIELVDLPPDDLLKRLKEGKVYRGELAGLAAENFFKHGNLIALRELALRHAAERVDAQRHAFNARHGVAEAWSVGERLLVGVSASPMSATLVRSASRLATRLRAPWIALLVETPAFLRLPKEERDRAIDHMRLAGQLGAETVTVTGDDVTNELIALAKSRHVTQLVLGKTAQPRWREFIFGSILNDVSRRSGDMNLHIISANAPVVPSARRRTDESPNARGLPEALAVVAAASIVCWPLAPLFDRANLVMIYLLGVALTAYRYGRKAAILAAILSVASFDFLYVPPTFTFAIGDTEYLLTFIVMLAVGLLIATVTSQLRSQTDALRQRAAHLQTLYRLSRTLSETPDIAQMLATAKNQLEEFYGASVQILTPNSDGVIDSGWDANETSVARWAFDHAQLAGAGSDTLSGAAGLYVPMKGTRSTVGVLAIRPTDTKTLIPPAQLQLLETFASEIGGAIESTRMSEEMGRAEAQMERAALNQPATASGVKLHQVLKAKNILIMTGAKDKEELIRELIGLLDLKNQAAAVRAILTREKAGATMIGSVVAIPHARMEGLSGVQAALAVSPDKNIPLTLLFISPASDTKMHLSFLAGLAAFFNDPKHISDLRSLTSPAEVVQFLQANAA